MSSCRLALLLAPLLITGCGGALQSQQPPAKLTTGFWLWRGNSAPVPGPEGLTLDVLYFQAGSIYPNQTVANQITQGGLPGDLPPAREYWMVFRYESQGFPAASAVPSLVRRAAEIRDLARQRHLNLVGLQLDADSPSGSLRQYSQFLHELRKALPPDLKLSITALLDWFQYSAGEVIAEVDEFVPQFYDVQSPFEPRASIAAPFDAAKWGPVLNGFKKPFRIGLSSFGRAYGDNGARSFADLAPGDFGSDPRFAAETSRNPSGELILTYTYRAKRYGQAGFQTFGPGQSIRFVLPTAEMIRTSFQAARRIGGNCAGVLFFRWPLLGEVLAMDPADVLAAAGAGRAPQKPPPSIEAVDGYCSTVACADLFLRNAPALSPAPARYRIRSSAELEYFMPEQHMPIRLTGPSDLELTLPAYGGRPRVLLGRAVSKSPVTFSVQAEP